MPLNANVLMVKPATMQAPPAARLAQQVSSLRSPAKTTLATVSAKIEAHATNAVHATVGVLSAPKTLRPMKPHKITERM
jgi:hypothetical protein